MNETHDPGLTSWVESANVPDCDFPIQNLPYGVFRRARSAEPFRIGIAIGSEILDLGAAQSAGALQAAVPHSCTTAAVLNELMAAGPQAWASLRLAVSRALRKGSTYQRELKSALLSQRDAEYTLPVRIGDYTDFYTSIYHATAVGRLFRPDNPLLPNYKWTPIGYHGRCSSIGVSGQQFPRPTGQRAPTTPGGAPTLGPSLRLDYELELGVYIGTGNDLGSTVAITAAESRIFGLCLLNDWSARDLQAWEYQPLGPFLGKNFATTVSPWIVSLDALEPYRVPWTRSDAEPQPLAYLDSEQMRNGGAFDIQLECWLRTETMRRRGDQAWRLSQSSFRHAYWTIAQMVTHHTVNGCNLRTGDLLGTGTQSGPMPEQAGSLLELSLGGRKPIALPNGETRAFLEDGDEVTMRSYCIAPGAARIGFGEATGRVLSSRSSSDN